MDACQVVIIIKKIATDFHGFSVRDLSELWTQSSCKSNGVFWNFT